MKLPPCLSVSTVGFGLIIGLIVGGCAGVTQKPSTGSGGSGAGNGKGGSNGSGGQIFVVDANAPELGNPALCGNGMLDPGEQCDEGQFKSSPGCTQLCQIEQGWACPTPGQMCVRTEICGNGVLEPPEGCDDGNTVSGDGCSSTCTVEMGWRCPVPGKPCIPICGDGVIEGSEQCDDGNTTNGDGCSSTCQIEPGATCPKTASGGPAPGKCTVAVCGNGIQEAGESCDCGTDPTKLPAGCTGPNGLFNGDGTGCSKTCTKEPVCRGTTGTGATHACNTVCGNGNVETGEQCDDGNTVSGDGCSSTCTIEPGFTCKSATQSDTSTCTEATDSGQCLKLPVKYRDFKNESLSGGHPDFFFYGATVANPVSVPNVTGPNGTETLTFNKRYCVPNSAGPARQNDSTARCWGIAQAALDNNGRPAFDTTRNGGGTAATLCDCQFTDWSHDTNGGHVPGYTNAANGPLYAFGYVSGPSGHPQYKGQAPVVASSTTFGQWWQDGTWESDTTTPGKHAIGTLELGPVTGSTNLYRFSSAPHSVWGGFFPLDPAANNYPIYTATGSSAGPGTVRTTPAPWSEPLLCGNWPYWYAGVAGTPGFGAANNCVADQYVFAPSFGPAVTSDPGTWWGMNPNGGWLTQAQGWFHDSYFSVEARYLFAFSGAFDLQFFGDDDTFVFVNGVLMIDLGGVHQRLPGKVHVNADGSAQIQEGGNIYMACTNPTGQTNCPTIPAGSQVGDIVPCDGSANAADPVTKVKFNSTCASGNTSCDCRQRTLTAAQTGLATGNTYEIAVFTRDGHPTESNFQLTLSGFSTTVSQCGPRCGDGVVAGGEECDCGDGTVPVPSGCVGANNDTTYNGCTTMCTYGPFCGDGVVQNPPEECDNGEQNGVPYTPTCNSGGCTSTCTLPGCCGDAIVQADQGEECDLGPNNGVAGSGCSSTCKVVVCLDQPCGG